MIPAMQDFSNEEVIALLNQIAPGNDKAAIQLYQHYHGFLYAFVRHRLADSHTADDITQEVFMAVFNKPQAFSGKALFRTWLCSIASNKCVDLGRKQRDQVVHTHLDEGNQDEQVDPNWDLVANLEVKQDGEAMRTCVDKLPPEQREAIFFVYFQDEGLEAVAKQLNCPVGTVKSRLFNARKKLHDCMSRWLSGGRDD